MQNVINDGELIDIKLKLASIKKEIDGLIDYLGIRMEIIPAEFTPSKVVFNKLKTKKTNVCKKTKKNIHSKKK